MKPLLYFGTLVFLGWSLWAMCEDRLVAMLAGMAAALSCGVAYRRQCRKEDWP